jgi:hypothetical protein
MMMIMIILMIKRMMIRMMVDYSTKLLPFKSIYSKMY